MYRRTLLSTLPATLLLCAVTAAAQSSTVNVQVSNQINLAAGVNGRLQVAMSTSFQLASWSYQFFDQTPQALATLGALQPQHTRVQLVPASDPLTSPEVWDFSQIDPLLAPIQSSGDHSPEFQIAGAPTYMNDAHGTLLPTSVNAFAAMSANLVRYYNTGGFNASGTHFQSLSPYPITWWGIFNEPNGNGLTPQDYVDLYNTMVPVMAQADPTIKFAAVELSDWGQDAESFLPTFVSNVTAPVDVLATHFYSTCNQQSTDDAVFPSVINFANEVSYIYSQLATQPKLASVPVWVTENNVNADYALSDGLSNCNGTPFVLDPRGTSPFFAAWRSLVFELLGQAGAQALYHWDFSSNAQYGETDSAGNPNLSYWVDYYLSHWLPSPPGQDILQTSASGCCLWIDHTGAMYGLDTHTLALRNSDGSVVILMSNHAVQKIYTDNNGTGVSRTFALDLSALGTFSSATLVTLDGATPSIGPQLQSLAPSAQMEVTLPGYGAALLRLANATPNLTAAGVVNGASFQSGPVAPGEIVSLFGSAIGPPAPAFLALTNPRLVANSLESVRVYFNGVPAPLLYASAGQVNVVVPYSVAGESTVELQLEYLGLLSNPVVLQVAATAPGVFSIAGSGRGPGAILNARDGSVNSALNPAARGDWVSIFATGAGITTPASVDGLVSSAPLPVPNAQVSVTMGGLPCPLNFVGSAPGLVSGVLQVNAQVPTGLSPGAAVPIQVRIGSANSSPAVTLAVR
ncbi:MAG: glycosyl hydrolase [Bryobacteraceae bacterium]